MDAPAVLITGALTGIGRATALAFARNGARVLASGRRDEAGTALVSGIAEAVVYAASEAAAFMTVHILAVDGGMTVQ